MASDHPFHHLFETLGRVPAAHAEPVNRQAFEVLSDILAVPVERTGRCILLRAPRAGHGKTHLLSRIQHQLGASYEFIPLLASSGCRIDATTVTDDTLRRLVRQLPASGGLTVLDLVTRRLFASALQPLVGSGEVPCQDREGALTALRARPIETFDFHHPNAVTAQWARENFEVLGQRLSLELAQRAELPVSDVAFWVDLLFRFASAPLENPGRVRTLADSVHAGTGAEMERLEALLGLLTLLMRVVLVADDLEGFSSDDSAALKLAAFLGSLRQSVERLDVILSLNQDIWQSAFVPRLSGGLADRLSEVVVELEPLTEAEMEALLESRVPGLGRRVLERIDRNAAGTHARGLIRAAGMAWLKATAMDSTPAEVAAPVVEPAAPPVAEPPPAVEMPAFSFSRDTALPVEESVPAWPAPGFAAGPPEEIIPEVLEFEGPVAASSHVPPPYVSDFQESSPANPWKPPALAESTPDPEPFQLPEDSPFQVTIPEVAPRPPEATFTPAGWQQSPPAVVETPTEPPFPVAPQDYASSPYALEPATDSQPIFTPPVLPAQVPPPPTAADTDRVDDLLRQFRERFGRGSL